MSLGSWAALFLLLFLAAHLFKFVRFYLVLLEERGTGFLSVLFLYTRTTLLNLLIPFKLGEFYRILAVSRLTGSWKTGLSCVAVDRFSDTAALLSIILPFEIFITGRVSLFPGILVLTLGVLLLTYLFFEPSYRYLNRYLILHKKSERAMAALYLLDLLNDWFRFIKKLITGRSPLILLSSFLGWGAELLALKAFAGAYGIHFGIPEFNDYIQSIFRTGESPVSAPYHLAACVLLGVLTFSAGCLRWRERSSGGQIAGAERLRKSALPERSSQ